MILLVDCHTSMNNTHTDYLGKFSANTERTFFSLLNKHEQQAIKACAIKYRMTAQDIYKLTVIARDLELWQSGSIQIWWPELEADIPDSTKGPERKKKLLQAIDKRLLGLCSQPTRYPEQGLPKPQRQKLKLKQAASDKKIIGWCPVASEKTLCCNLRNITAIENCLYGCSYCTIQTFYDGDAIMDKDLEEKLEAVSLEPGRYYHITTGQSSDSLAWGNKNATLTKLCEFARRYPDILLEFKTKSANVAPLLELDVPPNVVCSWSVNTETIIMNEEHNTASLKERLHAARQVADQGIKVAFHFHPIIHYQKWQQDYPEVARKIMQRFTSDEVLFISLGAVTFIKPVLKRIRERGETTLIHQMDLQPDPHGKRSYSDEVKIMLFSAMYQAFKPWHKKVFMYLCMERAEFWDQVLGYRYASNNEFETAFGKNVMEKIKTGKI